MIQNLVENDIISKMIIGRFDMQYFEVEGFKLSNNNSSNDGCQKMSQEALTLPEHPASLTYFAPKIEIRF